MSKETRTTIVASVLTGVLGLIMGLGSGYAMLDERLRAAEIRISAQVATLDYLKQSVDRIMQRLDVPLPPQPQPPQPNFERP